MISSFLQQKTIRISALAALIATCGVAQTAALSLSSGSGSPGSVVTLDLMLTASVAQPAGLEWTINYPTKDVSALNVSPGSGAASISCNNSAGSSTCAVWSMNSNTISNGVVATLAFTIAGSTTDTSAAVQVSNGDAVSLGGSAIPTSATGNTMTLNISQSSPVINSAATATGKVGTAFSYQITATNSPTSYGATGLPAGLSVNTSNGLISGTPTAAGSSTVALSATNSGGTGNATLSLTIAPSASAPAITSATTTTGKVGTAFSYQITASNSPTSFGATGLPAGLSVNASTGLISGTPSAAGTSTVTLSATNSGGTGNATLSLTIAPSTSAPAITSATTASGKAGTAFSYQITATNSPTSYGATGLPAGLSVNTSSGLISGTSTTAGTSTVTLSATNSGGTGNATLSLTIAPSTTSAPAITSATTASGKVGTALSYQITATNSPTSYGATGLPAGLSVNTSSGLISGTPTAAGTSTVTLSASNSGGTGSATLKLTVTSVSIAFVQATAKAASASGSSLSAAFPAKTAAGDFILVGFDFIGSGSPTSVTDSQGNALTQVGTQLTSPSGSKSRLYYAKNIKGGADTVKITLSASSPYLEVYLTEYSGVDPTNPIDVQAENSGVAGAVTSGNATTTMAGDLIYGYCAADAACSSGSGFAARSTLNDNLVEDKTAGNAGSYAATGSANSGWTMHMVALRPLQ